MSDVSDTSGFQFINILKLSSIDKLPAMKTFWVNIDLTLRLVEIATDFFWRGGGGGSDGRGVALMFVQMACYPTAWKSYI